MRESDWPYGYLPHALTESRRRAVPRVRCDNKRRIRLAAASRNVVCTGCKELGCDVARPTKSRCMGPCGQELGVLRFPQSRTQGGQAFSAKIKECLQCSKASKQRKGNLQAKLRNSVRKRCTCGRAIGHTAICPMHPRKAGEEPFPGCDVITRDEFEWLQHRNARN